MILALLAFAFAFILLHIACITRPLFSENKTSAYLLGIVILALTLSVYAINGRPSLAANQPASLDPATALINQAITVAPTSPQKAYSLLSEALLHQPSKTQTAVINIISQSIKNAENNSPTTP